jgi:hypothetical protein
MSGIRHRLHVLEARRAAIKAGSGDARAQLLARFQRIADSYAQGAPSLQDEERMSPAERLVVGLARMVEAGTPLEEMQAYGRRQLEQRLAALESKQ